MVSTRSQPRGIYSTSPSSEAFPSPASPSSSARSSSRTQRRSRRRSSPGKNNDRQEWTHTPSNLALIWLAVSLPLVVWDTAYVMLRPYSMPGGKLHWPLWKPYALYGEIDHVYGFKAYNARLGWTAAQATMNVVETLGYLLYLWIVWQAGHHEEGGEQDRAAPSSDKVGWWGAALTVRGRTAGVATLLGFAITTMTWSKTVLYWLNEAYSGWDGVGHNSWFHLTLLWIIPNLPWIPLPVYLSYVFASEILQGLAMAAGESKKAQ